MSTRTVIDCDKCEKQCDQSLHLRIPNGVEHYNDGHTSQVDFFV